ncbi:MAG: 2-oxoglutarate dehydrogenase E1 component, partial [Novosphingobium sp.]|nr:2-oxoglutarate dehydrogenase E1 component [Novosphingobium sp.]
MGYEERAFEVDPLQEGPQAGPSWASSRWPVTDPGAGDDLTRALDPMALKQEIAKAAKAAGAPMDEAALEAAAGASIRAMMLVRTYRVRGHLAADLDPLGLARQELPADITPEYHGFVGPDLDKKVFVGGVLGMQWATPREIVAVLQKNYCGKVGLEYMHIADVEERKFLQERIEGGDKSIDFTPNGKKAILAAVVRGEQYEKFLGKKYVGTKRFGLDGGESMIPALEAVIKYGGQMGVREIIYGMAHRGRLNVLANVLAKPYRVIFHE